MPRAAAPKPTGPDGENLTQWAIKIVVKFHEDCENGMHIYSGELKNALSIDGYPLSSLPTLYTQDRKYRQQFGVDAITTAVKNKQKAKKAKLAQSSAAAVEVDEQRCMGELRGMLRTAQKQQPVVHSDSPFKGTAADKKEIKREAYKKAVRLFSTERKKPNDDPSKLSLREVEDFIKAEHKGIGPGKDSIHTGAERFETTGTAEIKCYVLIHGGLCATTSLMHQSTCQQHPPGPETTAATCGARDHCDCYALLSLVSLLVRTPFWHAVLVDHKRREPVLPHGNWPPPT